MNRRKVIEQTLQSYRGWVREEDARQHLPYAIDRLDKLFNEEVERELELLSAWRKSEQYQDFLRNRVKRYRGKS